jgi:hypothetical protein
MFVFFLLLGFHFQNSTSTHNTQTPLYGTVTTGGVFRPLLSVICITIWISLYFIFLHGFFFSSRSLSDLCTGHLITRINETLVGRPDTIKYTSIQCDGKGKT